MRICKNSEFRILFFGLRVHGALPIGPTVVPFWDCLIYMNPKKELLWGLWVERLLMKA